MNAAGTARALVGELPTPAGTARATIAASVPVEPPSVLDETLGTLVPMVRLPDDIARALLKVE